jgi:hypothetical protein
MLEHSADIGQLAVALAAAQGKFDRIVKDTANPFFKSKYATLASIIDGTRKALADVKIAVVQAVEFEANLCSVTTILFHESGQWMRGTIAMPVAKLDPQGVGSASTYARRYGLSAFVNVAADDDDDGDGNAASKPVQNQTASVDPKELKKRGDDIAKADTLVQAKAEFGGAFKWAAGDTEAQKFLTAIWEGQKSKFASMAGVVQSRMEEAKQAANVAK